MPVHVRRWRGHEPRPPAARLADWGAGEKVVELRSSTRGQPDEPEEADGEGADQAAPAGGEGSQRAAPSDLWICTGCERVMDASGQPADPYQRQFARVILRFGRCAECAARP